MVRSTQQHQSQPSLQDLAKKWAVQEETSAMEESQAHKVEREKHKKAQSKARNVLRKLLRGTAEKGARALPSTQEYGFVSADELEKVCQHASLETLHEMNELMGGEVAAKEHNLLHLDNIDKVRELAEQSLRTQTALDEEEAQEKLIAREARQRELDDQEAPLRRKPERDWTPEQFEIVEAALKRYPVGVPNRWTRVSHYLNYHIKPNFSYDADEALIGAYTLANSKHVHET